MVVVLTIHNFKIPSESILHEVLQVLLSRHGGNWRSLLPVVFALSLEELEIALTVGGCLVDVLELVCVLMGSASFVEILLILSVVVRIVFTESYMGTIVPRRKVSH